MVRVLISCARRDPLASILTRRLCCDTALLVCAVILEQLGIMQRDSDGRLSKMGPLLIDLNVAAQSASSSNPYIFRPADFINVLFLNALRLCEVNFLKAVRQECRFGGQVCACSLRAAALSVLTRHLCAHYIQLRAKLPIGLNAAAAAAYWASLPAHYFWVADEVCRVSAAGEGLCLNISRVTQVCPVNIDFIAGLESDFCTIYQMIAGRKFCSFSLSLLPSPSTSVYHYLT